MNQTIKKPFYKDTRKIIITALFSAIASILMYIEIPLPFLPPFLKLDISGVASLIGTFTLGVVPGVFITLIKNLIHLLSTQTGGIGELADFIMTSVLCIGMWIFTNKTKLKHKMLLGSISGITIIVIIGCILNKYLLIPFYEKIMPIEAIISACSSVNPFIGSIDGYILWGVLPFNLLKGIVVISVTLLTYKKLKTLLNLEV
ncbi:MAG: ECF transporter S component [Oscillospiraceae bacterium]